ncbi:MAG: Sir2 family NAD-dependent protein deacetylase [Archangium sp.]
MRLDHPDTHLFVLTGAGVSAESGIPTFRGSGGVWNGESVARVASLSGFVHDPARVWRFYSERRAAASAKPNAAHYALAEVERRLGDRMLLVTQNIDGLHAAAGSTQLLELHGNLFKSRCSRCEREPFDDAASYEAQRLPACGRCHARGEFALLRPHVVWFGERIARADLERIEAFMRRASTSKHFVFLAAGTSGLVAPSAQLVDAARSLGADTWLVNADTPANAASFHHVVLGNASTELPKLLALPASGAGRAAGDAHL